MFNFKSRSFNDDFCALKEFHDLTLNELEKVTEISESKLQSWLSPSGSDAYQKLDAKTYYYIKSKLNFQFCEGSLELRSEIRILHSVINDTLAALQKDFPSYQARIEDALDANLILLAKTNELIKPDAEEKEFYDEIKKEKANHNNVIDLNRF